MFTLRENQAEPIEKAIEFFKSKAPKPSLIVLPTAWGKSILTAYVAKETTDKILILQPSKELLEQNYKKYLALCGFFSFAGIYSASFNSKTICQVTYATIGSIKSLGEKFKRMGFTKMLIDEAHLYPREADSMLGTFIKESGITHVLGITATPIKLQTNTALDGSRFSKLVMLTSKSKKGNFYSDIIHVGQVSEMVHLGFWSPLKYFALKFDDSKLVFNSAKSEYTEESVEAAYKANGIKLQILQALNSNADRKHILVFVPSVADAIEMASNYPNSAVVYGEQDKKEREAAINGFRSGRIRQLFNVRVLSTGFDYTGIDCIILGISTASIALYYQIIGRATRIDANKKDAKIIDFGGNVTRFGRVEDLYFFKEKLTWKLYGTGNKLLSGIPIHEIGSVIRGETATPTKQTAPANEIPVTFPYGKHKDKPISEIPLDYIAWALKNFSWNSRNATLKQALVNAYNSKMKV